MPDPVLNRKQSRRVDELAIQHYGMTGLVLMENAGRGVADQLCQLGVQGRVVVCCGKGNNGGDGFVLARHLQLRQVAVRVLLFANSAELAGDAAANWRILQCGGTSCRAMVSDLDDGALAEEFAQSNWLVDALLGTGASGEPRTPIDRVIAAMNRHPTRKLAVDLPSGLDCDTGQPARATVRADHTCTFVALKQGFSATGAAGYTGSVTVHDVGTPPRLLVDVRGETA